MKIYLIILNLESLYSSFFRGGLKLGRRRKESHSYVNTKDIKNMDQDEEHIYQEINENFLTCDGRTKKSFSQNKYLTLCVGTENLCNSCSDIISNSSVCSMCGKYYLDTKGHVVKSKTSDNKRFPNYRLYNDPTVDEDGYLKPIKKESPSDNLNYIDLDFSYDKYESTRISEERKIAFLLEELKKEIKKISCNSYPTDHFDDVIAKIKNSTERHSKKEGKDFYEKSKVSHKYANFEVNHFEKKLETSKSSEKKSFGEIENKIYETKEVLLELICQFDNLLVKASSVSRDNNENQLKYANETQQVIKDTLIDQQVLECNNIDQQVLTRNNFEQEEKKENDEVDIISTSKFDRELESSVSDNTMEEKELHQGDEIDENIIIEKIIEEVESNNDDEENITIPFGLETIEEELEEDLIDLKSDEVDFQNTKKIENKSLLELEASSIDPSLLTESNDKISEESANSSIEFTSGKVQLQDLKDLVLKNFEIKENNFSIFYKFFQKNFKVEKTEKVELLYYTTFVVIKEVMKHFSHYKLPGYFFGEIKGRKIIESKDIYKYDELFVKVLCKDILESLIHPKLLGIKYMTNHSQFRKVIVFFKHLLKITKRTKDPLLNNMKGTFKDFILKNKAISTIDSSFEKHDLVEEIVISLLKTMRSFK